MFWGLLLAAMPLFHAGLVCAQSPVKWQTPAQFHQLLKKAIPGTLSIDDNGIQFRAPKFYGRWPYGEIKTFELTENRELIVTDYGNRHWHQPGDRTFRFTFTEPMPPAIAAHFTDRVERPVINGFPATAVNVLAELPARERAFIGGSNGTLEFREDGIDYLATGGRSSRTWRWSDIQTIASPNPWEFRVTAYREIAEFDLKRPLSRELFDRLWGIFYAKGLNTAPGKEGLRQ